MTRFAIEAPVALRLAEESVALPSQHSLVAPNLLRSQALDLLYRDTRAGRRGEREALDVYVRIVTMRIRLLGDRVSQRTAWRIAAELRRDAIGNAEYIAVAQLQADALVTLDPALAAAARGFVEVASYEALLT